MGDEWQEYILNREYEGLNGKVILIEDHKDSEGELGCIKIYGDGNLLYTSQTLVAGCNPEYFSIDVSNVYKLRIEHYGEYTAYLADAYLYK